jgi:hypothetical protein
MKLEVGLAIGAWHYVGNALFPRRIRDFEHDGLKFFAGVKAKVAGNGIDRVAEVTQICE